jgi:hypothetical protein
MTVLLNGKGKRRRDMAGWTSSEYDGLFRDHPPTEPSAPHGPDLTSIGQEMARATGAVAAQWGDARSAVLGNKTAASEQLLDYLKRRGWIR